MSVLLLLSGIGWLAAQSTGPADAQTFRRVVVGEDRLSALRSQVEQGTLVELTPAAFESGLKTKRAPVAPLSLVSTLYRAKLVSENGEGHLQGTGEWSVHGRGELRLAGFRAAVRQAKWSDGIDAVIYEHPLDKQPHLHVPSIDRTLNLEWSARGLPEPGELRFDLRLPAAPIARLELELPVGMTPILSLGDVLLTGPTTAGDSALWQVSFGGVSRLEVILRRDNSGKAPLFTRVQSRHTLSGTEVETRSEFVVEAAKAGVAEMFFAHDRGFAVASVSVNNLQGWEATTRDGVSGIVVRLREPARSATVVIVGRSPVAVDGRWTCTALTLADGVSRSEKVRLAVSPLWRVRDWSAGSYSIARAELSADRTHVIDLEPGLGPSRPPTMTIVRRSGGWSASQEAEWTIDAEGERLVVRTSTTGIVPRSLRFRVPEGWEIDRVESAGRDLAWTVAGSPRRLEFERGSPTKGDFAVVRLKRPVSVTADIALPDLYPEDADTRSGQLSIKVDPSWELRLSDADGTATRALGPAPLTGSATLRPRADRTRITIDTELSPGRDKTRAIARMSIVPAGVPVSLIILWSPSPIAGSLEWRDERGGLIAEAVPDIEARARMMVKAKTLTAKLAVRAWRLRFRDPVDRPTTLTTSYAFEVGARTALLWAEAQHFSGSFSGIQPNSPWRYGALDAPQTKKPEQGDRGRLDELNLHWDRERFDDLTLVTMIDADGSRSATLRFTVRGVRPVRVPWRLPADAGDVRVLCDGHPIPFTDEWSDGSLGISLPPGDSELSILVRYTQPPFRGPLPRLLPWEQRTEFGPSYSVRRVWHVSHAWGVIAKPNIFRHPPLQDPNLPLPDWRCFVGSGDRARGDDDAPPGWTTLVLEEQPSSVVIYRRDEARVSAWIASTLLAAAVWGFVTDLRRRRLAFLALMAVAVGGMWMFPSLTADVFAPLLFTAAVAALLPGRSRMPRAVPQVAVASILLVGLVQAAPPDEVVTIVAEARGLPKAVFVPPSLLDRLHGPRTPPPVVIAAADYAGKADGGTATMTARFRVHAFVDGPSDIVVPLVGVRPRSVTLDGAEVRDVEVVAGGLKLAVAGKGAHALEVAFAVPVTAGREREAKFGIPEVPTTHVRFEVPPPGGAPRVSNWRGAARTTASAAGHALDADCGSGPTLSIRWPVGEDREPPQALSQSALWQVGPASATLSAAFDFRLSGSAPQDIALWVPAEVEIARVVARAGSALPGTAATRVVEWTLAPVEGPQRRLAVRVAAPASGRVTLFVEMASAVPLGERVTLLVPRSATGGAAGTLGVQLVGVEATAETDCVGDLPADKLAGIAWPTVDDSPFAGKVTQAYTTMPGKPGRITLIRKRSPAVKAVVGDVQWTLGQRAATARVETKWTATGASLLEWTLPDDVTVAGVTTRNLLAWSQSRGRVQVWLDLPMDEATVTWHAQKPLAAGRTSVTLPSFGFAAASTDLTTRARSDAGEVLLPEGGASLPSNVVGEVAWKSTAEQRVNMLPPVAVPLPAVTRVRPAEDGFETRTVIDVASLPRDRPHLLRVALAEPTTRPAWVEVPSGWSIAELPSAGGGRRWDVMVPRDRVDGLLRLIAEQAEENGWLRAAWRVSHGPLRPAQLRETIHLEIPTRQMAESRGLLRDGDGWQATEPDWQARLVLPTVEPPLPATVPEPEATAASEPPLRWALAGAVLAWLIALVAVVSRRGALFPSLVAIIAAAAMGPAAAMFWVVALMVLPVSRLRGRRPVAANP